MGVRAEVDRRTILGYYDSGGVRWDYSFFLGDAGMHFGYSKNPRERLTPFQLRRPAHRRPMLRRRRAQWPRASPAAS